MTDKERKRNWYLRNREHILNERKEYRETKQQQIATYMQQWRADNKDDIATKHAEWYVLNKETVKTRERQRYQTNKETIPGYLHLYYEAHADAIKARVKLWQQSPQGQVAASHKRANRAKASGSHTAMEWMNLKESYGNKCLKCGTPELERPLTQDHVIPLSKGGSNDISNIQPLCRKCNGQKGVKTTDYRY